MSKFNRNKLDTADLLQAADHFMTKAGLCANLEIPRKGRGYPKVYAEGNRLIRGAERKRWSYMLVFRVIKDQLFCEFYIENADYTDENYRTGYLQGVALRKSIARQCAKYGLPAALANDLNNALDKIKG